MPTALAAAGAAAPAGHGRRLAARSETPESRPRWLRPEGSAAPLASAGGVGAPLASAGGVAAPLASAGGVATRRRTGHDRCGGFLSPARALERPPPDICMCVIHVYNINVSLYVYIAPARFGAAQQRPAEGRSISYKRRPVLLLPLLAGAALPRMAAGLRPFAAGRLLR